MRYQWRAGARAFGALAVAGTVGMAAQAVGAQSAGAGTGSYTAGTMFVADQSCGAVNPYPAPGCLWEILPGGSPSELAYGFGENPQDVALDAAGNLYWTESTGGAVRELTTTGTILTLATGFVPWGIATDGTHVWFGSFNSTSGGEGIYEVPAGTSGSTPTFVTGKVGVATSMAIDGNGDVWGAGNPGLFVIPAGSSTAIPVKLSGTISDVTGVRINATNDVFVTDGLGDSVAELQPATGTVTTLASGLSFTEGVALDPGGDVFVGEPATTPGYGKVLKISGGTTTVYATGQIADTGGIAYWPPLAPVARRTVTAALSTIAASSVTTETKVALTLTLSPAVSGTVQFLDNGSPLGPAVHATRGVAHLTTTLPAGSETVSAGYVGGVRAPAVAGNTLTFTCTAVPSKTTITTPATTVPGDGQATVTATVTGHGRTPTGPVAFYDGTTYVGEGTLTSGQTTAHFSLRPGTSKVHAVYQGDPTFATSTSNSLTFTTVPPYTPTMSATVKYTRIPSSTSKTATITVRVTGVAGNGAPTGSVTADYGFACGTLTPVAGRLVSTATCSAVVTYGSAETVTVDYGGSTTYDAANTSLYVSNGGG